MATATEKYVAGDDESYNKNISTADIISQTFTIGTVGINIAFNISSVDLKITNAVSGTLTAEIFDVNPVGEPTGSALSTGTGSASIFDSGTTGIWGRVSMSSFTLQPSKQYALVLSATNSMTSRADGSSPSYAGGETLWSDDTGASWTADATTDLMFQINGADEDGTLCTTGEAIAKAGSEADSTATNPLLVSQFIQQAESYINTESEFNWNDNYTNLNDDVKFLLNRVCSADAAIGIITYNIGNYTSRVLAETMINIYREQVFLGINTLKDEAKRNFLKSNISS